jgi:hypothetical protein
MTPSTNEMKDLQLCLYGMYDAKDTRHAQVAMKDLGIKYLYAVPQSVADCWQFFCCENVPEVLPPFITEMNKMPYHERIGWGLSKEMADNIINKYKERHSTNDKPTLIDAVV